MNADVIFVEETILLREFKNLTFFCKQNQRVERARVGDSTVMPLRAMCPRRGIR